MSPKSLKWKKGKWCHENWFKPWENYAILHTLGAANKERERCNFSVAIVFKKK